MTHTVIKYSIKITQLSLITICLILGGCQHRSPSLETPPIESPMNGVPVEVQPMLQPIEQPKTAFRLTSASSSSDSKEDTSINQLVLDEEVMNFKAVLEQIDERLATHFSNIGNSISFELSEAIKQCEVSQPSLYHQMGHLVDQQFNQLSKQEAFRAHTQEGVDLLFSLTPIENPSESEAFAQAFQFFFEDPEKLLQYEELYKYFCTLIEQLQSH